MSTEILVAVIGAVAVVLAAWISMRSKKPGKPTGESRPTEIIGRDKISGDSVGRDKIEAHEHLYLDEEKERKSVFAYVLEKMFVFVFTVAVAGVIFGVIGAFVSGATDAGPAIGAAVGIGIAVIAGFVNAANVKRTKGLR